MLSSDSRHQLAVRWHLPYCILITGEGEGQEMVGFKVKGMNLKVEQQPGQQYKLPHASLTYEVPRENSRSYMGIIAVPAANSCSHLIEAC